MKLLILNDTYHRRKPAPAVPDCGPDQKSIEADALRARGTKRREILALSDLLCLLVSGSVEMSPSPNSTVGTSIGPEDEQR